MSRRLTCLAVLALAVILPLAILPAKAAEPATGEPGDDFRILYFEPLQLLAGSTLGSAQQKEDSAGRQTLQFDAYGRRFALELERNARVMQDVQATTVAYRGQLTDQPGSWTRLTRIGGQLHGLVWDGADLYVIEPAELAAEFMVTPPASQSGNVIYRLKDTMVDLGADFCSAIDTEPGETDGLSAFEAVTADLKSHLVAQQAAGATLGLRLSAIGDSALRQRYATEAEARDALLIRLNNVDGIYSAQLGVEIQITSVALYDGNSDPLSNRTDPNVLLGELADLRSSTPALRADGLTHLFTGRNLDGNTVGIGYIDALCRARYGAALTETRGRGATIESLIAAHEIGHNFGAVHDGTGACAATPSNLFIMGPQAAPENDTFSACSLSTMSRSIDRATCISALPPADVVAVFAPVPANLTTGQTFTWSVAIANNGGQQASVVTLEIALPAAIVVDEATVAGGNCNIGAGTVQCSIGTLPVNESRIVGLVLRAQSPGLFTVSATAAAINDANAANNTASSTLAVDATAPSSGGPPASSGSGGGGGGSFGLLPLLAFGLVASSRLRRP